MIEADSRFYTAFAAPTGWPLARNGLTTVAAILCWALPLRTWAQPAATAPGAGGRGATLTLRILDPREDSISTTRNAAHILGRTSPDASVTVRGEPATVLATGIFVRDNVPLQMGENRVTVVATAANGQKIEHVLTIKRTEEPVPAPQAAERTLGFDETSIEPAEDIFLSRGDILDLSFRGTPGQRAEYRLGSGAWLPMAEVVDEKGPNPSGLFRASVVVPPLPGMTNSQVQFRLQVKPPDTDSLKITGPRVIEASGKGRVGFWDDAELRLVRVKHDGAPVSFGLHEVRLGGPYLAELPAGTVLRVTGQRGNNYHARLAPDCDGWIESRTVEWAPTGTPLPHLAFTSVSIEGNNTVDKVSIPYPAPVPFAVTPSASADGRGEIDVDYFGAHNAATWISHRPTAKAVREVTMKQIGPDHLRLSAELKEKQLWGYKWEVTNNALVLTVRRPPQLAPAPDSPLKGLTIALEPGHGSPRNTGARGISGSLEKDVNRMAVEELARQFEAAGARCVVVRPGDEDPSLSERARRAIAANADLFISVHANSAGHERGYLRVSGTSTYYKWSFSRDFADAIHTRLLDLTKLPDFGNVGNFNYYPIRVNTWMPSMLVEQAFMSNPDDEAKMLDPLFRKEMMRAVVLGTEDWLKRVREEAANGTRQH